MKTIEIYIGKKKVSNELIARRVLQFVVCSSILIATILTAFNN